MRIMPGDAVGLVGESGSGKTILCRAILGTLHRHGARIVSGSIWYEGLDLTRATAEEWRGVRGRGIAYVPQSSLASLNPILTIGQQLGLAIRVAFGPAKPSKAEVRHRSLELLDAVEIPHAASVLNQRPHQLSGGMRQRVVIAAAVSQSPKLLVADEPTTALDVRVQRTILDLLSSLRQRLGLALLLVSHDISVIEEMCDVVTVMYAGSIVEAGPRDLVLTGAVHPYTLGLIGASVGGSGARDPIPGEVPTVGAWPDGCRFWPRCALSRRLGDGAPMDACRTGESPVSRRVGGRSIACHFAEAAAEMTTAPAGPLARSDG
jgi:oligopeptide/dipeptide ABC transporter ATP-binding protein